MFANHKTIVKMKSKEQINKIKAVVLYILNKFPDGVDYIKLFKIMYFAQKDYLVKYGKALCPDTFKARTFGPVPALSDKVIKIVELHDDIDSKLKSFCQSIRVENQLVFAVSKSSMNYLSKKECLVLDKWFDICKDKDSIKDLSPESHDEAYERALKRSETDPQLAILTNIEIAKAGNASDKMIGYIRNNELFEAELV